MLIRELRSGRFPQPMTTRTIASPNPDAPKNPKQTYEAALGELRGEETTDRKAKTPIYRRKQEVATSTDTSPEPKRALADAAAALAALWKTSSPKAHQSINAPQGVPRSRVPCPQLKRTMHASSHMPFGGDRKSTRLNSSHVATSYAVFCLKKKIELYVSPGGEIGDGVELQPQHI